MTTSDKSFSASKDAAMSRTLMAAANSSGASARSSRRARSRTWSMLSSPLIYMTRLPARASVAAACSISVLLPMPGSPPTSTTLAGTSPPPSTRSSSAMPVSARGGGVALPCNPTKATRLPAPARPAGPGRASLVSSTMVFHSPHASQRPAHLG